MVNLLLYLILFAEIVFFTYFDRKVYANYFSPVIILSYPILIVVTITFIFSPMMGYNAISSDLLLLMIIGIFVFWFGSFFWGVIMPSKVVKKIAATFSKPAEDASPQFKRILLAAAWVVILFLVYSFFTTYRKYNDVNAIGTEEFVYSYAGSSVAGHVMGLTIPFLVVFIGIVKKKDYLIFITIIFFIVLSLLYQVKTWLYIPIIGGILLRWFNNRKMKIRMLHVILFVAIVMVLFGLTYVFSMQDRKNAGFFEKVQLLFNHFMGYVFAGVLGFGEQMKENLPVGQNPKALFMPFINLYHYFTGGTVEGVVSPYHVFIDKRETVDVNVKTFFGTILINGGYLIGMLYTAVLSVVLYFIWIVASITKNFWAVILYVFLVSALALGWFDFYYNQLPFLELPIYLILLILISKIKFKKSLESTSPG